MGNLQLFYRKDGWKVRKKKWCRAGKENWENKFLRDLEPIKTTFEKFSKTLEILHGTYARATAIRARGGRGELTPKYGCKSPVCVRIQRGMLGKWGLILKKSDMKYCTITYSVWGSFGIRTLRCSMVSSTENASAQFLHLELVTSKSWAMC